MSSHSISIVPKQTKFSDRKAKKIEILDWLISKNIIKPSTSDCILSSESGYGIAEGAKEITLFKENLPFNLMINGLEITTKRQIFHTEQNGIDECICQNCNENIATEFWDFLDEFFGNKIDNLTCTNCGKESEINNYKINPQWGFSNIGFTFWNWPEMKEDFIQEFQERLGVEICVVHTNI